LAHPLTLAAGQGMAALLVLVASDCRRRRQEVRLLKVFSGDLCTDCPAGAH
jgi:hypothetical protein